MITDFKSQASRQDCAAAIQLTPDPNAEHGIGFLVPEETGEPYPNGFWKSFTTSGRSCGLGFYCHKCHLLYVKGAPEVIWHCGGETAFNAASEIATHKLGSYVRYATETERLKCMRSIVDGELANIAAEKAARVDMLAPEVTLFDWCRNTLRGIGRKIDLWIEREG
jgi:hypothetical protein